MKVSSGILNSGWGSKQRHVIYTMGLPRAFSPAASINQFSLIHSKEIKQQMKIRYFTSREYLIFICVGLKLEQCPKC
mgnify:CR=1 FL=1